MQNIIAAPQKNPPYPYSQNGGNKLIGKQRYN